MNNKGFYLLSLVLLNSGFSDTASAGNFFYCRSEPEEEDCCTRCDQISCCPENWTNTRTSSGFFVSGEYLYWNVCQDGLAIAGSGTSYPGKIKHVDFNWTSGFRVGLGGQSCDGWAFEAAYTYIRPKGSAKVTGDQVYPIWIPPFSTGQALCTKIEPTDDDKEYSHSVATAQFSKAKSKTKFDYNLIDVELRGNIPCSPCFSFEVIGGLQGGILEQRNSAKFTGNFDYQAQIESSIDNKVAREHLTAPMEIASTQKWKFAGGGIRVGASGEFHACSGFLLFAASRYNVLYGNSKLSFMGEVTEIGEATDVFFPSLPTVYSSELFDLTQEVFRSYYNISGKENFCNFVSNINSRLGFGFENSCGCLDFRIEAAWEITYWPNLAQYRNGLSNQTVILENDYIQSQPQEGCISFSEITNTTKTANDVALHGLVFSVQLMF